MVHRWRYIKGLLGLTLRSTGRCETHRRVRMFGSVAVLTALAASASTYAAPPAAADYRKSIQPLMEKYCFECHADGVDKGGVAFDELKSDDQIAKQPQLWWKVLKNVRSNVMPPPKAEQMSAADRAALEHWIKYGAFAADAKAPDPGRVTVRRLNRVEYRNTIRDLMGVDFKVDDAFPPDDTGYGFDNIGDVLTVSPLLLEKYMQAAEQIVDEAVPRVNKRVAERTYSASDFGATGTMSFYKAGKAKRDVKAPAAATYRVTANFTVSGSFNFDPGRAKVKLTVDGKEQAAHEFGWGDANSGKKLELTAEMPLSAGDHAVQVEIEPLVAESQKKEGVGMRIGSVRFTGPLEEKLWAPTPNYAKYFPRPEPPKSADGRREYATEILRSFTLRAFRRPADARTLDRLVKIAEAKYGQPGESFEDGVAQAMVAALSSPRFLFRVEDVVKEGATKQSAYVDEYALASRLSYFLWSTMPDEPLFEAAKRGELRKGLEAQVKRMLADPRSEALVQNFVGQWMQTRDVETMSINARAVLGNYSGDRQTIEAELRKVRQAMHKETEMYFAYVMREGRSVLDFIDSDYTFLNDKLAKHYDVPGVQGSEMRRVTLPKGSPRGGLLTQGTTLLVTSNPTRTSPVKRGLFVLDNVLGTPAPPAPPDVPQLEESLKNFKGGKEPTMREALEAHRNKALCASCHARMDPIGFALENFNALGGWRDKERGKPIDATGKLISGENFTDIRELKTILKDKHKLDFYRCLTEKLMTYALGRGMEYYDTEAVDQIVERLDRENGSFAVLLKGVIESSSFQRRRTTADDGGSGEPRPPTGGTPRADIRTKP